MSGITSSVNQAEWAADESLGSVVLQCRPRRRINVWLESGTPPLPILLAPFLGALVLTILPLGVARSYFHDPPPLKDPAMAGVTVFWFALCIMIIFCYYFSAPQSSSFLVCQRGFRYRGRVVRYPDLASVHVGLPDSEWRKAVSGFTAVFAPFSRHARSALHVQEVTTSRRGRRPR